MSSTKNLPEEHKFYTMEVNGISKKIYTVDGITKQKIMKSSSNFIKMENGDEININFIIGFFLNSEETKERFHELPDETQHQLLQAMNAKPGSVVQYSGAMPAPNKLKVGGKSSLWSR